MGMPCSGPRYPRRANFLLRAARFLQRQIRQQRDEGVDLAVQAVDSIDDHCTPVERAAIDQRTTCSAVGSPETVGRRLREWWGDDPYDVEAWWEFQTFRDPDR